MTLTKVNSKVPSLFDEMDEVMKNVFQDVFNPEFERQFKIGFDKVAYPKTDIIDEKDKIIFEVDVNRLTKQDISVEIEPAEERNVSHLIIKGDKQKDNSEDTRNYLKKEIKRSSWKRAWTLSEKHYNVDNIKADVKDGLLIIEVPKVVNDSKKVTRKLL